MAKPTLYFVPKTLYLCCTWIKSYLVKGLWIIINYSIYSIHEFNPFLYQSSVKCNSEDDHLFWSCLWLGVILLGDVGPLTPRPNVSVAHDMAMLEVGKKKLAIVCFVCSPVPPPKCLPHSSQNTLIMGVMFWSHDFNVQRSSSKESRASSFLGFFFSMLVHLQSLFRDQHKL